MSYAIYSILLLEIIFCCMQRDPRSKHKLETHIPFCMQRDPRSNKHIRFLRHLLDIHNV